MVVVALAVGAGVRPRQRRADRLRQDRAVHRDAGDARRRPRPRRDHRRPEDPDRRRSTASPTSSARTSLGIPMLVWIFALVAVVGWVLLNRTTFGRRTVAVGGNPEAARLAGINVKRHTVYLYVLVGLCCGIAAVMLVARTTTGSSTHGNALRARRDRRGRHRRHAAHRRPRHDRRHRPRRPDLHDAHQRLHAQQPAPARRRRVAKGVIIVVAVLLQQRLASREQQHLAPPRPHRPLARQHHTSAPHAPASRSSTMSRPMQPRPAAAGDRLVAGLAAVRPRRRAPSNDSGNDDEADVGGGTVAGRVGQRRRRATRSSSASPAPRPTTAGWARSTSRPPRTAEKYADVELQASPRAPTTPTCRSARSRPSSTTRSTRSCCCRPTAPRSPRSPSRRWRPASRSSTSTASSTTRSPPASPSSATTTAWASRAGTYICEQARRQAPTPSSPRSPASTRCR